METANYLQDILHSKTTLKIITKTKNERLLIEKWIKHHLAIIGEGKLIIFDNMSDDEYVLDIYEKYKDNIILIKFASHHNDVHSYELFKDLYDAVAESTDFFTVLDTDEFLYLYDDNKAIHDTSILDYLRENKDCDFFAPCWLDNIEEKENLLNLNSELLSIKEKAELIELFDWGKAIINAKIVKNSKLEKPTYFFTHTTYLPQLNYKKALTKFFIAHLKKFSKEQRILTNMNKLVSHQVLSRNNDFEGLLKLDPQNIKNGLHSAYVRETQRLKGHRANPSMSSNIFPDNTMKIGNDDTIHFSNPLSEKEFSTLANSNYLDLIHYDYSKIIPGKYPCLITWIGKYNSFLTINDME